MAGPAAGQGWGNAAGRPGPPVGSRSRGGWKACLDSDHGFPVPNPAVTELPVMLFRKQDTQEVLP